MKASETKLQRIIEGTNQYVVPLFQRTYSWDTKEWTVLWDDIMELCDEEEPRSHFMGSIVTTPTQSVPEGVAKFLLIDGQQRMTTIFIMLAAIRDHAKELGVGTLAPEIEQTLLKNMFKQGNDTYKLLPTQGDREAFIRVMTERVGAEDDRVSRAYRFFAKKLRSEPQPDLVKLSRIVVGNLLVVSIVLERDDNPHLIFESLNAKGRPLSQADLIRNYFFMRIHVNEQETLYLQHWKPMQDRLGEDLTECIRHFLMRDGAIVKQGEVYFALKERADQKSPTEVIKYLQELAQSAEYYGRLLHPEEEPCTELRERMRRLNRIEVTTAYPFLLNVYRDYVAGTISKQDFVSILDILENFMIRRWVRGVPTYGLNKVFPGLYSQAAANGSLVDGLREVLRAKNYPRDAEFKTRLASTKLYGAGDRITKTKLILEMLEASYGHREPVDLEQLSIEHVMPQTLTDSWRSQLGENWESTHELFLHTIGNLTLTGYNTPLSNEQFERKREILLDSHLELNRYFEGVAEWNEQTIRQRAETMADRALIVWPYFGPRQDEPPNQVEDVTGRVPTAVVVMGQRFAVESWRDVMQQTLGAMAELDTDRFEQLVVQFPRFLGRDPNKFRASRPLVNGVHVYTNLSAASVYRFCIQATEIFGLSAGEWYVEFI